MLNDVFRTGWQPVPLNMMTYQQDIERIKDPLIRAGLTSAIEKNLLPAAVERAYPGHFNIVADGSHYGGDSCWPGLDGWEMAGAYWLIGKRALVANYAAFVRASQKADGNVPIAICPGEGRPAGSDDYGRGIRWPQDVYTYGGRKWVGLYHHWQMEVNPLSVLAPISLILTAEDMDDRDHIDSAVAAGRYVLSRKSTNGLIAGAGFYIENPPRNQWDGVTQCYAVHAFRVLAKMSGDDAWTKAADELADAFRLTFWKGDHFAEYVHPSHGVVDSHGLSDTNWAAVAWDVATDEQKRKLWPRMTGENALWAGEMPTQLVAKPQAYEEWEKPEPLPFVNVNGPIYDAAAMGRVWFLEARACVVMKDWERLRESTRLVCAMGEKHGGFWFERYHMQPDGSVKPAGPKKYCEYAAVLVRVVLGNIEIFIA